VLPCANVANEAAPRPVTIRSSGSGYRLKSSAKVDRLAEALSIDRSFTFRWLLLQDLESKSWLLRTGNISAVAPRVRAMGPEAARELGAEGAFARARPKSEQSRLAAEIKPHRASMEAADKLSRLGDRVALQSAKRPPSRLHQETPPYTSLLVEHGG
jgi:hypothetical protein